MQQLRTAAAVIIIFFTILALPVMYAEFGAIPCIESNYVASWKFGGRFSRFAVTDSI